MLFPQKNIKAEASTILGGKSGTQPPTHSKVQEIEKKSMLDSMLHNLSTEFVVLTRGAQTTVAYSGAVIEAAPGSRAKLTKLLGSDVVQKLPKEFKPPTASKFYWEQFVAERDKAARFLNVPATVEDAKEAGVLPTGLGPGIINGSGVVADLQMQQAQRAAAAAAQAGATSMPWWKVGVVVAGVGTVGYIGYRVVKGQKG